MRHHLLGIAGILRVERDADAGRDAGAAASLFIGLLECIENGFGMLAGRNTERRFPAIWRPFTTMLLLILPGAMR